MTMWVNVSNQFLFWPIGVSWKKDHNLPVLVIPDRLQ